MHFGRVRQPRRSERAIIMKRLSIFAMVLMSCHSIYLISIHLTSHTTTTALESPAGQQQASATNPPVICPITGQPLNPSEVCSLTLSAGAAESKNSATDTTEDAVAADASRFKTLTPEEINIRMRAASRLYSDHALQSWLADHQLIFHAACAI